MTRFYPALALMIVIVCLLFTAGCTSIFDLTNQTNTTPTLQQFTASYKVTIAQPDGTSKSIKMDTDVYNLSLIHI